MTRGARLFGLPIVAMLAGCVHTPVQPQIAFDRTNCDAAFVTDEAAPLKFDPKNIVETDVRLNGQGRCVRTEDAAADYYASFVLPRSNTGYTLSVGALPEDLSLLAPQIRLMNEQGEVTRSFTAKRFLFRGNRLTVLVQPRPDETRLVVLSDHKLVGQTLSRVQESVNTTTYASGTPRVAVLFAVRSGEDEATETTFSFAGLLKIATLPIETKS